MISQGLAGGRTGASMQAAQRIRPCSWRLALHAGRGQGRMRAAVISCSAKATELLARANDRYRSKDLMAAMKLYEDVLGEDGVTTRQKQAAFYGSTAVHASFGDIELAQITLREGIRNGLDFEQALSDPDLPDFVTSPQMLIQLRRFNGTAQGALAARANRAQAMARGGGGGGGGGGAARGGGIAGVGGGALKQDPLGSIIGSSTSDVAGVDTSIGAVIRRVLLLLLALTGLGVGLFYLGLEYVLKVN
ncbi:MAG: hypothetical protein J3K34DRAFT_118347 [Monoraphidium minutum]|nr:MAG: hypothetical protein J3K34DRAFT_118347 [Monoraphidium minutum]